MGLDGIEVSCGIMEDGYSMLSNVPIEAILSECLVYRNKNLLFHFIMRNFGRKIIKPLPMIHVYSRARARAIKSKVKVPVYLVGGITDLPSWKRSSRKGTQITFPFAEPSSQILLSGEDQKWER